MRDLSLEEVVYPVFTGDELTYHKTLEMRPAAVGFHVVDDASSTTVRIHELT
jgi:hypothetical protein